jgi:hypothetical protein
MKTEQIAAALLADRNREAQERTELYRHYDDEGKLLYVGISLSTVSRLIDHKESPWFGRISHIKIERFPTRKAALIAEQIAITMEGPEYNKAMNNGSLRIEYDEPTYEPAHDTRHVLRDQLAKGRPRALLANSPNHPSYTEKICLNPECEEVFLTQWRGQKYCSPCCNGHHKYLCRSEAAE